MPSSPSSGRVDDELSKQGHTSRRVRQLIALALSTVGVSSVAVYVASAAEHNMAKSREKAKFQKRGRKLEAVGVRAKKRGAEGRAAGSNERKSGDRGDLQREKKRRRVEGGNGDWVIASGDLEHKVDLLIQPSLPLSTTALSSTSSSSLSSSSSSESRLSSLGSASSAVRNAEIERDEYAIHLDHAAASCGNSLQSMLRNLKAGIITLWHSAYDEPFFEVDDECSAEEGDEGEEKGSHDEESTGYNPFFTLCKTMSESRQATFSRERQDRMEVPTLFAPLNEIVDTVRRSIIQRGGLSGVESTKGTQKRKEEASHNATLGVTMAGVGLLAARNYGRVDGSVNDDDGSDEGDEDEQAFKDKIVALQQEMAQEALMLIKTSDGFDEGVDEDIVWKCRARSTKIVVDVNKYLMRMYGMEASGAWDEVGMDEENGTCEQAEKMILHEIQCAMDANVTLIQAALGSFGEERRESDSTDDEKNIFKWEAEKGLQSEVLGSFDKNRVSSWLEGVNQGEGSAAAKSETSQYPPAAGGTTTNANLPARPKEKGKSNPGRPRRRRTEGQKAALEKARLASKASRLRKRQEAKEKEEARLARRAAAAAAAAAGVIPRKKGNTRPQRKGRSLKQRENLEKGREALRTKRALRAAAP